MARLTLLTATYNSAATVTHTLRSVAAQTYPDVEHILIDGASSDATMEIVGREGGHLAKVVSEPDEGIYHAWNKGLDLVSGDVIGFLNSDDFYAHPGVAERVMGLFAADPRLEAVHADMAYVDRDDGASVVRWWKSRECTPKSLARGFIPAHPTLFLRRSVYDRAGRFDLRYRLAADYEFMLRIFHAIGIQGRYVPEIWVRMRTGGATGGNLASIKLQNEEIRDAQRKHGIHYPGWKFFVHKAVDRAAQRWNARSVVLPDPGFEL